MPFRTQVYTSTDWNLRSAFNELSALLIAAIYIGCRQMGVPRTLDDIAIICNIKRKSIAKCYRQIITELDLKLPMIDTTKCIARVANKVNISERTKHRAINLMNDVVKSGLSAGKDPMGLAATVVYASCVGTGEQTFGFHCLTIDI
jgi:transcription initiation factor TFIIB